MENPIHRFVFATDFSACSVKAFGHALAWAKFFEAQLTVVHVVRNYSSLDIEEAIVYVNVEEQVQGARQKLETYVSWGKTHVTNLQSELLVGIPVDQVCQFALEKQSELIIMGAHGWSGLDRVLMGSMAERVVCQAPCPVLVIPAREKQSVESADVSDSLSSEIPPLTPGRLLIPVDFSDCSLDAFEYGTGLAKKCSMTVSLLHVVEPVSYSLDFNLSHPLEDKQFRHQVETRLSELTGVLKKEGLRAEFHLANKHAVESIVKSIGDTQSSLVVMGTHGRRGLSRLVMGSITAGVLRNSPSPILTVKSPKFRHVDSPTTP